MTRATLSWFARMRDLSLAFRAVILGLVVVLMYGLVAPVAWYMTGTRGLLAEGVAAGVCLLGAVLALVVSHLLRRPAVALYGLLFAMALRMGIPLGFAVALHLKGWGLVGAGIMYYLVGFYLVTLGVETGLSLPRTDRLGRCQETSQDVS